MKHIVRITYLLALVSITACSLEDPNSLSPDATFVKFFGGAGVDKAADFVVNYQGNEVDSYVIFGSSNSYDLTQQGTHTEWVLIFTDGGGNLLPDGVKRFPVADLLPDIGVQSTGNINYSIECIPSKIKRLSTGGYLLIGSIMYETTAGEESRHTEMLVVKVDESGNYDPDADVLPLGSYLLQAKVPATSPVTYDTVFFNQWGSDVVEVTGGFLCVGTSENLGRKPTPNIGTTDFYMAKLTTQLDTIWTKSDGSVAEDYGIAVVSINGGDDVVIAADTRSRGQTSVSSDLNAALIKFPMTTGAIIPENKGFIAVGSVAYDESVTSIVKLADNDMFLTGNARVAGGQSTKPFLARVTSDEVQLNTRMDDLPAGVFVSNFYRTIGGRFIYAATTAETDDGGTNGSQLLLMRTDDFGGETDNFGEAEYRGYRYGGSGNEVANAVVQLPDGKFVILATVGIDNNPQTVIGLIKTNANGILGK
jgi:hypothetical protein